MRRNNNWYHDPSGQSEIDLGFGNYGRQHQQWNKPRVQILTPRSYQEELQKQKLCTQCHNPIAYLPQNQKWICYRCQISWIKDFDTPLTNTENSIKPLQSNDPYERESPVFISAKRDKRLQGENKYVNGIQDVQVSGNGRVVKIKTTNLEKAMDEKWIQEQLQGDAAYGY